MPSSQSPLQILGISPLNSGERPEAYAQFFRVARQIRDRDLRAVGLVSANEEVSAIAVALQLALALIEAGHAPIEVVDSNTATPSLSQLAQLAGEPDPDGSIHLAITDEVQLSAPPPTAPNRLDPAVVAAWREVRQGQFRHILFDLSGFAEQGVHGPAYEALDGVLLLARSGATKEREVAARYEEIPEERRLGVLLVG